MKLLSVAIPSYNVQFFLPRCLDSLLYDKETRDYLDIIIVNDGSQDETLAVAKKYAKEYDCVRVVDKENGGHGSTVNSALKVAKGKYFKVVDADDWVNIFDFKDFVKDLKEEVADIVVCNYKQDILYDSSTQDFIFCDKKSELINADKIQDEVEDENFFFKFSMHSMTVKTDSLRAVWGSGLLEKTFYVDQQFVALSLLSAKTYKLFNYDIYRYFIGRPDQSMNPESFFKHRKDHERVLKWLLALTKSSDLQDKDYLKTVLQRQITLMLRTHYAIYHNNPQRLAAYKELVAFNAWLGEKYPEIKRPQLSKKMLLKSAAGGKK